MRVLGAPITAYWAKPRYANFVLEKYGYVNADAFGPHPILSRKIPTFFEELNVYALRGHLARRLSDLHRLSAGI